MRCIFGVSRMATIILSGRPVIPIRKVTVEPLAARAEVNTHYSENPEACGLSGLEPASRHYFRLRDQHGTRCWPPSVNWVCRARQISGISGATPPSDGRQVKWGYLFRSGKFSVSVTRMWSCWRVWNLTWSVISGVWRSRQSDPAGCRLTTPAHRQPAHYSGQ